MEKITSESETGKTVDHIPLQYRYTAGVAGDRFFRLLKQGKLQASYCRKCNKLYLPPKIFCKDCFSQLDDWKDVREDSGYVYSFTTVRKNEEDAREEERETIALVKFEGIEGGILGRLKPSREEPKMGMKVRPVFRQKNERKGGLSDIEYFEKITTP